MTTKFALMAGIAATAIAFAAPASAQQTTTTYNRTETTRTYEAAPRYDNTAVATPSTGPYVGVMGGYNWTDSDGAGSLEGTEWGVFAGVEVGAFVDDYLNWGMHGALEGHYLWSDSDGTGLQKNDEWGVSFRPGFDFVDNTMPLNLKPYAILGYRRAEFEAAGVDEDFDGFELGIGTELVAYGDVGVRLDYTHVFYEDNAGLDPSEDNVRLGLAYHF
jgi:opacity protein-like surface antigen